MIKDTTVKNDVINKIINIIDIEKGLSKNSKNAYASDIILMNDWFSKQNINFLNAKEIDFKNLFSFFKSQNLKQNSI
ncbi:MAG: site-specific integrase, partial [Alphaproteobacteria bacterium]|nr:site-specific integrase [Alphaproteobacteria bacterium]